MISIVTMHMIIVIILLCTNLPFILLHQQEASNTKVILKINK